MTEVMDMDQYEREMEIIALLSNVTDDYTYVNCDKDIIEHDCNETNEKRQINLVEVEYFKDGQLMEDKANFCEHCNRVFVYNP